MYFQIEAASLSDIGQKRKINQDFLTFFEPQNPDVLQSSGSLYIVADGVGGASKGEQASKYAAEKVRHDFYKYVDMPIEDRLQMSMREACFALYHHMQQTDSSTRMATTMVAVVVRGEWLTVANVGDSRAYLLRGGKIRQITKDHSYVGELVRGKMITEEEARKSNIKNRLTRSLGGEPDTIVDIFKDIQLFSGDRILLCSDGLTRYASDEDLLKLSAGGSPETVVARLVQFANQSGGADNVSVIFISVEKSLAELETTLTGSAVRPIAQKTTGETPQPPPPDVIPEIGAYTISPPPPGKKGKVFGGGRRWIIILIILLLLFAGAAFLFYLYPDLPALLASRVSPSAMPTATMTSQATATQTSTSTDAVLPQPDDTSTPTLTETLTPTPTLTSTPTETPTDTLTPTATLTGGGYGQIAFASNRSGIPQIYVMNIDGSNLQQITDVAVGACQPDWSPDGKQLVYVSPCAKKDDLDADANANLYIIKSDGTGSIELPKIELPKEKEVGRFDPAWSPDGTHIAYSTRVEGLRQIHLFNLSDNTVIPLTTAETTANNEAYQPAWSPSGDEIAYTLQAMGIQHIWTMTSTGLSQEQLVKSGDAHQDYLPAWSPDDRFIFFSQTEANPISPTAAWLMRILSKNPSAPQGERIDVSPPVVDVDFSADGKRLIFESSDGINQDIYMMDIDKMERTRLTNDPKIDFDPAWRPSSRP